METKLFSTAFMLIGVARPFQRLRAPGRLDAAALAKLAPAVVALATAEGLPCHRAAVARRAEVRARPAEASVDRLGSPP
jgi:histidinol dehydrogenase